MTGPTSRYWIARSVETPEFPISAVWLCGNSESLSAVTLRAIARKLSPAVTVELSGAEIVKRSMLLFGAGVPFTNT